MAQDVPDGFEAVTKWLQSAPGVETVYGDPVERDDRTVVPVAQVRYGVAGGFGWGSDGETDEKTSTGGGGGGTGGARVTPVGALEVSDSGTEFVRFEAGGGWKRVVLAAVLGIVLGVLLGWRSR
ncbi:GerW family sporulation protein [Halorarius litoreus]|uniref:GerW family sporulation protein n=1 Tax=Halorarius litoreus TaxID=2962676 RepID=UPI0020CE9CF2|nr:spore germination protein GerW family protein [Halorarius litoreus]